MFINKACYMDIQLDYCIIKREYNYRNLECNYHLGSKINLENSKMKAPIVMFINFLKISPSIKSMT